MAFLSSYYTATYVIHMESGDHNEQHTQKDPPKLKLIPPTLRIEGEQQKKYAWVSLGSKKTKLMNSIGVNLNFFSTRSFSDERL